MSKRRDGRFERAERDFYATPAKAVAPLLPHLAPGTGFVEPCRGKGHLIEHLERAGHRCAGAFDLPDHDARTERYALARADCFITNPPHSRPPRHEDLMHPILANLSDQAPLWALIDSDWLFTGQAAPFMPRMVTVVAIGRVRWIAGTKSDGFDNYCWCLFDRPRLDRQATFIGRTSNELPPADPWNPSACRPQSRQ